MADALRSLDPLGDGTLTFDEFCRGVGSIIQQSPAGMFFVFVFLKTHRSNGFFPPTDIPQNIFEILRRKKKKTDLI